MPYRFPRRVAVCMVANQAIFLDTGRDRYFSVGGAAAQAVQALLEQRPAHEGQLGKLVQAGLVETGEPHAPTPTRQTATPTRSLVEEGDGRPAGGIGPLLEATVSLIRARHDVKRQPLASIIDGLVSRKASSKCRPGSVSEAHVALAATFNAARRLAPVKPSCLPDSLALLTCLARRDLAADLVFGVKLHPFSAHCWVQAGDLVLNDAIDQVTVHTPILVV